MRLLGAFCFAAALMVAQPTAPEIPVVTVCDVLSDLARYNGKSIILVGLQNRTYEGSWVVAECEKKLVTNGFTWGDSIALAGGFKDGTHPPVFPDQFHWNNKLIATKLKEVKQMTKRRWRGSHWVVVFGRLEASVPPKTFAYPSGELRGAGFGHLNGSPAQIMLPLDYRRAWRTLH